MVEGPRVVRHEVRPLDPEQARQLIKVAREHGLGALVTVAVALGLRQGEALGLQWRNVDLDKGQIKVCQALQRSGRGWTLVEPKSARSRRTVVMPKVVSDSLRAHRTAQREQRLLAGSLWQDYDFVFTSRVGTPLEGRNVGRAFHGLLEKAGLPRVRFHDLRHTAATLLLAQGVDARTIMETLGHSQISLLVISQSDTVARSKISALPGEKPSLTKKIVATDLALQRSVPPVAVVTVGRER